MAIADLNPAAAITNTNWDSSNVSELDQGETSNTWNTTNQPADLVVTLDDFDFSGLGATSITSVQLILVGNYNSRSGFWTANTEIQNSAGSSLYPENLTVPAGRTASTLTGTVRTTSDGSAAWTDSDLDGMRIRVLSLNCATKGQLIQFYIKVAYETGYGHTISGVASSNIDSINTVATANIAEVIGVD